MKILGLNRSELKDIVKKAERNGYVTIEDAEGERTYAVKLTDEGREVARTRRRNKISLTANTDACLRRRSPS